MSTLTDNIVIIWMLPVLLQIVLPLTLLVLYFPLRTIKNLFVANGREGDTTFARKGLGV